MATDVVSRSTSSDFLKNDSQYGLGNSSEASYEFDFGTSLLLKDAPLSGHQYTSNRNWFCKENVGETSHTFLEDICPQSGSEKETVSANKAPLSILAENNLKKDILGALYLDNDDFNLAELLSDDNCSLTNPKNTVLVDDSDLFDLCQDTENNLSSWKLSSHNSVDILSDLKDSSCASSDASVSLDVLAANHLLNNGSVCKLKNEPADSFIFNLKNDDSDIQSLNCLGDVLSLGKEEHSNVTGIDILDMLTEPSSRDNFDVSDEKPMFSGETSSDELAVSLGSSSERAESSDGISEDELFPEIDLSTCITKKVTNKLSSHTGSPESEDSGFDEIDLGPVVFSITPKKHMLNEDFLISHNTICPFEKQTLSPLKQSLFSRAISARPLIDDVKKAKLKKVREELLKKNFPVNFVNYKEKKNSHMNWNVIDNSNECVVKSSFMKCFGI